MQSNMEIEVKFMAGTEIREAVEEARYKAAVWGVAYVCFDFNGTKFSIGRNCNVVDAINEFTKGDNKYGIVHA